MAKNNKTNSIFACVEEVLNGEVYLSPVKIFKDSQTLAREIQDWLGITDISHVYKSIKGSHYHAYRHPDTKRKLVWIDPENRPDLVRGFYRPHLAAKTGTVSPHNYGDSVINDKRTGEPIVMPDTCNVEDYIEDKVLEVVKQYIGEPVTDTTKEAIAESIFEVTQPKKFRSTSTQQMQLSDTSTFTVVAFSDSHVIPDNPSLASKALLAVLKQLQPKYVACLGDTFDFASISKHAKAGWEKRFSVQDELKAGTALLNDVVDAAPRAMRFMTFSNHDGRYDGILAAKLPEFEGVMGFSLKDHIGSDWNYGISLMVNNNAILKHQWNAGVHAAWNNVLKSGISIITGHTHKQGCKPYTDYTGTRFGVEVGTLSEINNPMYNYTEHAPVDWISGFVVLTFVNGKLITPEFASVLDGNAYFRGEKIAIN